jgi:hypothetical protein
MVDLRWPAGLVAGLLCMWLLAPLAPVPTTLTEFRISAYGSTLVFFLLVTGLVTALMPWLLTVRGRRLAMAAGALLVGVVVLNVLHVPIASDITKVALGVTLGTALLFPIDRPWWLLPIGICVPLADAWSVYSSRGVTHAVVEHASTNRSFLDFPTIATPLLGFDYDFFGRIGIVDILFLTLFVAAGARWGLGVRRLLVALPLAMIATTVLAYESEGAAVPALPILCVAFLACTLPALWRDARAEFAARDTDTSTNADTDPGASA